jgi:hypothetical protein
MQFSRQGIAVNLALCKRTSEKRFEILRKFATMLREYFFQIKSSNWIYLASKLVKKRKIGRGNFFAKRVWVFREKKRTLAETASI